ncbi:hypothetical protein ACWEO2_33255 [Nocardia sp. NPDC004278]
MNTLVSYRTAMIVTRPDCPEVVFDVKNGSARGQIHNRDDHPTGIAFAVSAIQQRLSCISYKPITWSLIRNINESNSATT